MELRVDAHVEAALVRLVGFFAEFCAAFKIIFYGGGEIFLEALHAVAFECDVVCYAEYASVENFICCRIFDAAELIFIFEYVVHIIPSSFSSSIKALT